MADRYWVGGTASWDTTAGTKWASTSGGAGGAAVPTASDDVFFDGSSGSGVCTVPAVTVTCRSLDFTGYTGTFAIGTTTSTINIGTTTPGPGNVALKLSAGMTWTNTAIGGNCIRLVSTSATQQTITTAGKTMPAFDMQGIGGSWILTDSFTGAATFTHTAGSFDTGSQAITVGAVLFNGTVARTLSLGSSAITCSTQTNAFLVRFSGPLTMTANTAIITMTHASANGGASVTAGNMNGTSLVFSGAVAAVISLVSGTTLTVANITVTGTAVKTGTISASNGGLLAVTGTLTINGNSVLNRLLFRSTTIAAPTSISAANVSFSNIDCRDITASGAANWNLSAITGLSGDCGGNTGITFTSPTTQSVAGTASFTWSLATWTSRVPLPQDTAAINNAFIAGRTVTMDMPRTGGIIFTGSGNVAFTSTASHEIYGHLTFRSGMGTITMTTTSFVGVSQQNFTTAGNTIGSGGNDISASRSVVQLQDAFTGGGANIVSANGGTWDTQSFAVTCRCFILSNTSNNNALGTSTITVNNTSGIVFGLPGVRAGASNADFIVGNTITTSASWGLGGATIKSLTWTGSAKGLISLTGGGTIGTMTIGSGRTVTQTSGTTINIGTLFDLQGSNTVSSGLGLPGSSGNYASTPTAAALDITADVTLVVKVALADWTPSAFTALVGKYTNASNQRGYMLALSATTGIPVLYWGTSSTTFSTVNATAATGFTDGSTGWLAVSFDVDNGAGGKSAIFYKSTDGIVWTQLGTTVTSAGVTSVATSTQGVTIGSEAGGTTSLATGNFYSAQIWSGVRDMTTSTGGTKVFDVDFTTRAWGADTLTETANNAVVTINGEAALGSDGAVRYRAVTAASAATLSKTSGTVSVSNVVLKDSTATGGATFTAINSSNVSGNTGWNFITSSNGNFLQLF